MTCSYPIPQAIEGSCSSTSSSTKNYRSTRRRPDDLHEGRSRIRSSKAICVDALCTDGATTGSFNGASSLKKAGRC